MAGSRGYAAASPGVPLWSPLAPLAPLLAPHELRMLDSCDPETGSLLPEMTATPGGAEGAEMAGVPPQMMAPSQREATAAPEGPAVAAPGEARDTENAAEAGDDASHRTMPAGTVATSVSSIEKPAQMAAMDPDTTGKSTAQIGDTIQTAADNSISASALGNTPVGQASDQCVIRISRLAAVSTARGACDDEAYALEEAHSECTEMNMPIKVLATAAASMVPGDTVSIALEARDSSQAKTQQGEDAAAVIGEAGPQPAFHAAKTCPSQASDSSAVPVVGDSDTPRSALIPAPAATAMGCPPKASATIRAQPLASEAPHQSQRGQGQQGAAPAPSCEGAQGAEDHQSALELARSARTLASRAAAAPLSVDHPLVKRAALEISRRTAIERSTLQVNASPSLLKTHQIRLSGG